jgi:hypothetical protein
MIHTKIKDLNIWGGNYYTIEEVPENREIVDSIPSINLIKPYHDGNDWIESATTEEKQMAKENEIALLNTETKRLLSATDEYVTRELDRSSGYKSMPTDIYNERLNIRQAQWEKEQKIIEKYS